MRKARIGDIVYYYPQGNPQYPQAAMVTQVWSDDLICVAAWDMTTNRHIARTSIHRHNSAIVLKNPAMAFNQGTWDFRDPEVVQVFDEPTVAATTTSTASTKPKTDPLPDIDKPAEKCEPAFELGPKPTPVVSSKK